MPEEPAEITPSAANTSAKRRQKYRRRQLAGLTLLTIAAALGLYTATHPRHGWLFYWQRVAPLQVHRQLASTPTAARIVAGARAQVGTLYNPEYTIISYPNGDVPRQHGACTDVVIRALRATGYDLQQLVHEDMQRDFAAYPHTWGLTHPDANIDHRRVPNQMIFFKRHGRSLTTVVAPGTLAQWQPGDIVYWDIGNRGKLHTGVVSDTCNSAGVPFVIHNAYVCVEQDCLTQWKIIGHFRYPTNAAQKAAQPQRGSKVKAGPRQLTVT